MHWGGPQAHTRSTDLRAATGAASGARIASFGRPSAPPPPLTGGSNSADAIYLADG